MIRIAVSPAAFDAIAATLLLGSVGFEGQASEKGERLIWLDASVADRLRAMRAPGESYSDVILGGAGGGRVQLQASPKRRCFAGFHVVDRVRSEAC